MRKLVTILAIILLLIQTGCGLATIPETHQIEEDTPPTATPGQTDPVPRRGGVLSVPVTAADTLNPLLTKSVDMLGFLRLIFEPPVSYDAEMKPTPSLFTGWEVSPDGRLWIFDVRKGVTWHNGQPLTGEDILFTIEVLQSGALNSFYQKDLYENSNIVEYNLRAGDPYTVYLRLGEPTYRILDILTFPVLPKSVYQSAENMLDIRKDFTQLPVGTGPYQMDPSQTFEGDTIRLIRNENWWGSKPNIATVVGKIYDSSAAARAAFQGSAVDLLDTNIIYANTRLNRKNAAHYKYLTSEFEFLGFNSHSPLLQDHSVRTAIAYALDRKDIISKVYLNNAETVDVPIPSNSWLYDSRYRVYDYDPKKALRILHEGGWSDMDGDGILDKMIDGEKTDLSFTLLTNSDNDFRRDTADLIAKQLMPLGLHMEIEVVPWDILQIERLSVGEYDAVLTGYSLDRVHDLRFFLHSNQIGAELGNFLGYSNPELDQLLDNAARAYTEQDRWEAYQGIQKHLITELPIISLYFRTGSVLVDDRVHGLDHLGKWNVFRDIEDWYLAR